MKAVYIGIGACFGAMTRFYMGEWLQTENGFPVGTLTVNLIGCLVLGWFLAFVKAKRIRSEVNLLVGTGFLGSFTTFSTFSVEGILLIQNDQIWFAFLYAALTIVVGILFAYFGYKLGNQKEETA